MKPQSKFTNTASEREEFSAEVLGIFGHMCFWEWDFITKFPGGIHNLLCRLAELKTELPVTEINAEISPPNDSFVASDVSRINLFSIFQPNHQEFQAMVDAEKMRGNPQAQKLWDTNWGLVVRRG